MRLFIIFLILSFHIFAKEHVCRSHCVIHNPSNNNFYLMKTNMKGVSERSQAEAYDLLVFACEQLVGDSALKGMQPLLVTDYGYYTEDEWEEWTSSSNAFVSSSSQSTSKNETARKIKRGKIKGYKSHELSHYQVRDYGHSNYQTYEKERRVRNVWIESLKDSDCVEVEVDESVPHTPMIRDGKPLG